MMHLDLYPINIQNNNFIKGIKIHNLIDILSYIERLTKSLSDPQRQRGFKCHIEIGQKVPYLMQRESFNFTLLTERFITTYHKEKEYLVKIFFSYMPPSMETALSFDNLKSEKNPEESILSQLMTQYDEKSFEEDIYTKITQKYQFIEQDLKQALESELIIDTEVPLHMQHSKNMHNLNHINFSESQIIILSEDDFLVDDDIPSLKNNKTATNLKKSKYLHDIISQIEDSQDNIDMIDDIIERS